MLRLVAAFLASVFLSVSALICAGEAGAGTVFTLHFMSDGVVLFYTSSTHTNVPSCAASQPGRFLINGGTAVGKTQVAGLLSAYMQGKQIVVVGTGTCPAWGTESVDYFYIIG